MYTEMYYSFTACNQLINIVINVLFDIQNFNVNININGSITLTAPLLHSCAVLFSLGPCVYVIRCNLL